jgi:hypothetical protein
LDHFHVPGSLKRLARDNLTGVFALYMKPDDYSDPEIIAHVPKYNPPGPIERDPTFVTWHKRGLEDLQNLTAQTGGKLYQVDKLTVRGAAREVVEGLRRQCLLTYSPLEDGSSSNWRKIEVTAAKKGWKVRHRPGYIPEQAMAKPGHK